ncbi:Adenylate cyclase [hydrothermal vent metagenome]|uniref:Adenylate cyclase n=1 Tax=hydrothermal vent metagenome TaxID=652676 RepID=A0A3B1D6H3_9ZZZZ
MNNKSFELAGMKILIVDDTAPNIDVLRKTLEPKQYEIAVALSGEAALTVAPKFAPDLILLDIRMPGIDGYETCRKLKTTDPTKQTPVIFISANNDTQDILEGFKAGGVDYVTKPFQAEEVLARVHTHLQLQLLIKEHESARAKMKSAALELLAKNNRLQETLQQLQAAQKKLVQSEKLASIGRLAEGMCHEILNPLNNISGLAQAIEMEREKDESLLKDLASVKEEIKRIETITSALVDFSAKGETQLTPTNINELIQQVLENLKNEGQLDNIEVQQKLAPDLPDSYMDTHLMRQVFANLATNAKDAMPENGTLTVSTELPTGKNKTANSGQIEGAFLRVKFSDTGKGIPKEHLGKIFDPFFSTDQDKTGMGLALCHSVVEKHEGSLTVVSDEGKETTFIIDLPVRD